MWYIVENFSFISICDSNYDNISIISLFKIDNIFNFYIAKDLK